MPRYSAGVCFEVYRLDKVERSRPVVGLHSVDGQQGVSPINQNRRTIPVENLKLFCELPLNCVIK